MRHDFTGINIPPATRLQASTLCEYKNGSEANELLYNGKGDKCKGVTNFLFPKMNDISEKC